MALSRAARRRLGNLADQVEKTVAELIRDRGGNAANVRQAGLWAERLLGDVAEAAAHGDRTAAMAIKIVKQAKRLGEEY